MIVFFFPYTFSKISQARNFGASKHYGSLEKNNQKFIVDECASHVTIFVQALSLGLAGERRFATPAVLAIKYSVVSPTALNEFYYSLLKSNL